MEWLVVGTALGRRQRQDETLEACVPNPSSDDVWEGVVPGAGTTEVPSTFEGVGVELKKEKTGKCFLTFSLFQV